MEPTIYMNDMQDVDYESGQVHTGCLDVPLILREIFQYFSSTELLQFSLVNKRWSYETRSLVRTRGNIIATANNKKNTCQRLAAFASDLERTKQITKVVPFSGMAIILDSDNHGDSCAQFSARELDPAEEEIVGDLTSYLAVRFVGCWENHKNCPGFQLVKNILEKFGPIIEELALEIAWNPDEFIPDCLQHSRFSRLKIFRLKDESEALDEDYTRLIKAVVTRAPNLQLFHSAWKVNLGGNLLEGSSAVHVSSYPYSPSQDEIPESVAGELRLERMNLFSFSPNFSLQGFNRITSKALQVSRTTLTSMNIDAVFLVPLMNFGICLENVSTFEMDLDPFRLQVLGPHIWRLVKSFDFTRTFPNLNTINMNHSSCLDGIPEGFNEMIAQRNAVLREPLPDRAVGIKHLRLTWCSVPAARRDSSFQLLAQLLPDIERLSVQTNGIPFDHLRDSWLHLQELDVTLWRSEMPLINLDSALCGIFPEEVAELRGMDEEYLQRVNIVPVMPTVIYLKELRVLKVLHHDRSPYYGPLDNPTCILSKVAGLVALKRCPNLNATLATNDERLLKALDYLRPYASVALATNVTTFSR